MVEALVKKYRVSESLEALKILCRKNGGPTDVFASGNSKRENASIEANIAPWIKDYQNNPDYKRIKSFQREYRSGDKKRYNRYLKRVKGLIGKFGKSREQQLIFLISLGAKAKDIQEILDVSHSWYVSHHVYTGLGRGKRKGIYIGTVWLEMESLLKREGCL